jgi:hypothetical protein
MNALLLQRLSVVMFCEGFGFGVDLRTWNHLLAQNPYFARGMFFAPAALVLC